ncbi:hypothetical protein IFM89_026257 [Coptis chinensis]|uniref:Rotamase n=1 Tax=Coptis chinensis TaxID=261450 RepID=A0A835I796_9MAGN|nr:hypothetical protein IFM89_026257 [Coptis chinensis]
MLYLILMGKTSGIFFCFVNILYFGPKAFHSFIFLLHVGFDGLDRAVMTMKKGEVVESTIALEYGFGSSEFKQELAVVTPNSTMKLSLNPLSSLQAEAKGLQTSRETMHKGNCGLTYAYDSNHIKPRGLSINVVIIILLVLERESTNVRALYRHAQAYIQLANLDIAGIDIKVLEIDPNTVYWAVCLVDVLVVRAATFLNLCSW